jgi:hypothetical protein
MELDEDGINRLIYTLNNKVERTVNYCYFQVMFHVNKMMVYVHLILLLILLLITVIFRLCFMLVK